MIDTYSIDLKLRDHERLCKTIGRENYEMMVDGRQVPASQQQRIDSSREEILKAVVEIEVKAVNDVIAHGISHGH